MKDMHEADDEVLDWQAEIPQGDVLPILAVTSANYRPVFSFWESSLRTLGYPRQKIHVVDLGELAPPFGYCTDSWRCAIDRQLAEVVKWITSHPGEYFIHTDTDIQFFPEFVHLQREWLQWMQDERLDIIFMRERTEVVPDMRRGEVNAGFCVVHCNERTRRFWQRVLDEEQAYPKMDGYPPYTDQFHLNRGLGHRLGIFPQEGAFGVRWATIPDCQCIWGTARLEEVPLAAFHHAVNTPDKAALLKSVRRQVRRAQPLCTAKVAGADVGVAAEPGLAQQIDRLADAVAGLRRSGAALGASQCDVALRRLLVEVQALAKSCAQCGLLEPWRALRWRCDDGQGYCQSCWREWCAKQDGARTHYCGTWVDAEHAPAQEKTAPAASGAGRGSTNSVANGKGAKRGGRLKGFVSARSGADVDFKIRPSAPRDARYPEQRQPGPQRLGVVGLRGCQHGEPKDLGCGMGEVESRGC
ncbi:unnamed protein product [Effrenium voratum]|uniref:Nucleotide-diphospho-sugar transferase domain-containing protein n=1 Tax=Effrenium voratum TaxID=2562239 RepID=A0AA36I0P7_9DINO|nr:unnamed protein product [Effrenium voratum]